jgi:hypothetical protein
MGEADAGGTEIVTVVRAPAHGDSPTLLLERLPRSRDVIDVSANCLLHMFFGGSHGVVDALTEEQVARLRPPPRRDTPPVELTDVDRRILRVLERDGRADLAELVAVSGLSQTTLRRRLADLRTSGALYFDVDVDYRRLDMDSQTILWLTINPKHLEEAGEALAKHPEVAFDLDVVGGR